MQSETIGKLAEALAKAQGAMTNAVMDGQNPAFKRDNKPTKYATLTAVWDACRKPLADNGLAVVQAFRVDESGMLLLVTKLVHVSGEWMVSEYPVTPTKNDPQGLGSAVTYARRYTLSSLVGVVADDDDDGNAASGQQSAARQTEQRQANGNGKPAPVQVATGNGAPGQAPQNDNPFDDASAGGLSDKQQKMIHAVGMTIYGDGWNDKRSALVSAITDGRTEHASDMTKPEASGLINYLKLHELGIKAFGSVEAFEGKTAQAVAKFGPLWKWQRKDIDLWTQKLEAAAAEAA